MCAESYLRVAPPPLNCTQAVVNSLVLSEFEKVCTHTHTHTNKHTYTHTHMHTYTHAHTHTYTHTHSLFVRLPVYCSNFFIRHTDTHNALPTSITNAPSLNSFKNRVTGGCVTRRRSPMNERHYNTCWFSAIAVPLYRPVRQCSLEPANVCEFKIINIRISAD